MTRSAHKMRLAHDPVVNDEAEIVPDVTRHVRWVFHQHLVVLQRLSHHDSDSMTTRMIEIFVMQI